MLKKNDNETHKDLKKDSKTTLTDNKTTGKRQKTRCVMDEEEVPRQFYNVLPDLPTPLPMPKGDLGILPKIFPKGFLEQEMSQQSFFEIPEEVRQAMITIGRPTPLQRAERLEKALGTPARIYFKREDTTATGSHKINTALMQVYLAKKEGYTKIVTETGAGQWGTALALAGSMLGMKVKVYMVRCSYDHKPYRKYVMQLYGAEVLASPSDQTRIGKELLKDKKNFKGSLGIAIAEAIEEVKTSNEEAEREAEAGTRLDIDAKNQSSAEKVAYSPGSVYTLGSVLNAVLAHQTVIGIEAMKQLELLEVKPDVLIGCTGGGSNFGGFILPFYKKYRNSIRYIAAEPENCPSLTKGKYKYDYGDIGKQTPLIKMHSLGADFIPQADYAGGLRYHGMAPIISLLKDQGVIKARAFSQDEIFEAGQLFSRTEGIIPAPETCHAIKAAIDEAIDAKKKGLQKNIVICFSGHGLLDLQGYADVLKLKG